LYFIFPFFCKSKLAFFIDFNHFIVFLLYSTLQLFQGKREMLGHIKPPLCHLPLNIKNDYKNLYCSICYSLRQQFSVTHSVFVNNELTLVLLGLNNHFTGESAQARCPAHLFLTRKTILKHSIIDTAAQFSLILAWIKLIDWETDSPAFYKTKLKNSVDKKVQAFLPTLNNNIRQVIDNYIQLTKNASANFDKVSKMSGILARQVAQNIAQKADNSIKSLDIFLDIIELIGQIIATADPLLDLEKDIQKQAFNPISAAALQNGTEIKEEYSLFKQFYDSIEYEINQQIQLLPKNPANTAFAKTLFHSLLKLKRAINNGAFSGIKNDKNQKDKRKSSESCQWCDCFNCCDCYDCLSSFNICRVSSCSNCCRCNSESCGFGNCCEKGCHCDDFCKSCNCCDKCDCDHCDCCDGCNGCDCCSGCDCSC